MPDDLNADAIYAALVYVRVYAESERSKGEFSDALDKPNSLLQRMKGWGLDRAVVRPVPKIEIGPETIEEIYPGERASVEVGIELARMVVFNPSLAALQAEGDSRIAVAIRRFIADRTH
jgi:hypothetical protein